MYCKFEEKQQPLNFELRELFQKAFMLWDSKPVGLTVSRNTPVFKFFKKFQILLQQIPFNLGFENYVAEANVGKGNWAGIPWIGLRNKKNLIL